MRFAYADPPYPGQAARWYKNHPDYGGEVDHAELIARLVAEYPDGWALSTSATALQDVLALCPPVEVAIWHVRNAEHPGGKVSRIWRSWEPLIWRGGHAEGPVIRNLVAAVSPSGFLPGMIAGQKPAEFCRWMFGLLGAEPGDQFDDLFPGSGSVGKEWEAYLAQPWMPGTEIVGKMSRFRERYPKQLAKAGVPDLLA